MTATRLEHVNVTVSNPEKTAAWMGEVFGWHIRWKGAAKGFGRTIHVGTDDDYVALFSPDNPAPNPYDRYRSAGGLNHIAVVVDNLVAAEKRVKAAGFTPVSHADYEPGRRFYFHDHDDIEFEVVQYD